MSPLSPPPGGTEPGGTPIPATPAPAGLALIRPAASWWRKLAAFDAANFGLDSWPEAVWEAELCAIDRSYLALVADPGPIRPEGRVVGLGGISHGPEAELLTIAIDEHLRGRGLGAFLLGHLLEIPRAHRAEAVFLEVRSADAGAQRLYERAGFYTVGLRKKYYHDDDAVLMRLDLAR
ncbi:GNAT family N-acetyltransferase [Trueperella pecoris]|uniref:GNAT family N-acetyltransferase n=1 Tax=Trueperella pecoris TaxID=2733571 RepID=UPI00186BB0F9|nr:GNAT family N-acetyltransferase [Trueperella pecoris]QOQ38415.1 GNAT family N-acetyltransferase [Trueperella pecoris]